MRQWLERAVVDPLANQAWRGLHRHVRQPPRPLAIALLLIMLPLRPLLALGSAVLRRRYRAAGAPRDLEILRDLAARLARQGDYRTAAHLAEDALAIAPDDPTARRVLADARAVLARPAKGSRR